MKRDNTFWNYVAAFFLLLTLAYFVVADAHAEETDEGLTIDQVELLIASCSVANAVTGVYLENQYYMDEAVRWKEFLIGFTNYNEGAAWELIKTLTLNLKSNLESGETNYDKINAYADENCIPVRDYLLEISGATIDDWYSE